MKNEAQIEKIRAIAYKTGQYVIGLLFLLSGFAKGVNPFGLSIQFGQYFEAMGIGELMPLSELFAIALPSVEMLLGMMLILGLYARFTRLAVALFMAFFTLLTAWIAWANPVSDCGCFGDLIKLSNTATFWKNIVADLFVVMLFTTNPTKKKGFVAVVILSLLSLSLPTYCNSTLPLIENSPYAIGRNIGEQMIDQSEEKSLTLLEYTNKTSGLNQMFTIEDTTWHDTTKWVYVATHTTTESKGEKAAIQSLAMLDSTGMNQTDRILQERGVTYLIIAPDPDKLSTDQMQNAIRLCEQAQLQGKKAYLLRSVESKFTLPGTESLTVDRATLHAMMQNRYGGMMTIENGVVVGKDKL